MRHCEITAELVAEADRRLAGGATQDMVAAELGITPYVARRIADHRHLPLRASKVRRRTTRLPQDRHDAATIRMIERMLAVGVLPQVQIGREVGVSEKTVSDVASGRRQAVEAERPFLSSGERWMRLPIRCRRCGAKITVAPCRACQATTENRFSRVTSRA